MDSSKNCSLRRGWTAVSKPPIGHKWQTGHLKRNRLISIDAVALFAQQPAYFVLGENQFKGLKVFDKAELIVFNRNGQVVYQSGTGYNNKWDGTYAGSIPSLGKDLPEGVYFYVFKYNGQNREPITGNFYIKR